MSFSNLVRCRQLDWRRSHHYYSSMREEVHNTVQELRERAGVTQEELSGKVGVSRQTIIAIEKGNYTPSVLLALKLARFFKRGVDDIFSL